MKYKAILFELDGTLTDPFEGITKSVQFALQRFGICEPNLENLKIFIGSPFRKSVEALYGLTPEQSEEALKRFRDRLVIKGVYENKLYYGISDLLRTLKEQGVKLAIASSKPHVHINRVLVHFGIETLFDAISGSELDGRRAEKDEALPYALELLGIDNPHDAVMVGHRAHDAEASAKLGMDFIAAAYAAPKDDEFDGFPCVFKAESIDDMKNFFIK